MEETMKLNEFQELALRTAHFQASKEDDLLHGAAGVCTEGGELMDIFKRFRFYGKPVDWVHVKEEAGDVLWYLALVCHSAGISLEEVAKTNIEKLRVRYPQKFDNAAALNRDLDAERRTLEGNNGKR
jgi:NTP pyrophosphatase (non-canonical NTP hydrolase)